jgi:hypothetical protein
MNMATKAMDKLLGFFKGAESKKEEAKEKKLSPAAYAKGEKAEGVKSTSAKKPMRSAAVPVKKTVAKATPRPTKKGK